METGLINLSLIIVNNRIQHRAEVGRNIEAVLRPKRKLHR